MISENLPRRTGLSVDAGPGKGFEWRGIWASIVISENLPRHTGLSANAGPGTGLEWTPGGGEPGAERHEAGEICMFNHWATGLRSGLLPQVVVLQHQKLAPKRNNFGRSFREDFDFWSQGNVFWMVLVGSRRSPASFLQGLATLVVRWEVSYKEDLSPKK